MDLVTALVAAAAVIVNLAALQHVLTQRRREREGVFFKAQEEALAALRNGADEAAATAVFSAIVDQEGVPVEHSVFSQRHSHSSHRSDTTHSVINVHGGIVFNIHTRSVNERNSSNGEFDGFAGDQDPARGESIND
ncbi:MULTISPECIES: hypothetical protein [unclassified Streptomyces]|uniref:hypothetical protein n=1 Tax=unclassified Streptomyces TaxID=2593676 RepID=UPI0011610659|nr:hypothetical protein [Streptomyces sp. CB02058]